MSKTAAKAHPQNAVIEQLIHDVPDFPKKGIVFKDITPLLADPGGFKAVIDQMCLPFEHSNVEMVAGIESRGFLLAAAVAYRLGVGLIPIRKKGKLPRKTVSVSYSLEYGTDSVEAHEDAIAPGAAVLVVDDVLATGGTAMAACTLMEKIGAKVVGASFLIELDFLKGREKLKKYRLHSLVHYS